MLGQDRDRLIRPNAGVLEHPGRRLDPLRQLRKRDPRILLGGVAIVEIFERNSVRARGRLMLNDRPCASVRDKILKASGFNLKDVLCIA